MAKSRKIGGSYLVISLCLILSFGPFASGIGFSLTDTMEILRLGRETVINVLESWELIRPKGPGWEEDTFPFIKMMEKEIKNRIEMVSAKIDFFQKRMENRFDQVIAKIMIDLPMQQRLDHDLREFDKHVSHVNDLFEIFKRYSESPKLYERYTMEDFAKTCVSSSRGALPDVLKSIHRMIVPSRDQVFNNSILISLANQMQYI